MPVKIIQGPFLGIEGLVVNRSGKIGFFVSIAALQRSVVINIAANDIAPISI